MSDLSAVLPLDRDRVDEVHEWTRQLFHHAITEAAHSPLLARLMGEIAGLIRETRIESLSQSDRPQASLEGHRRIAEAVRQQDRAEAGRAVADHIRLASDVALLRSAQG